MDGQKRITRDFLIHLFESIDVDPLLALKTGIKDLVHILHGLNPLVEVVEASAFLAELTLDIVALILEVDHRQGCDDGTDINLVDISITIKIIDVEYELDFFVKSGAVDLEEPSKKLSLVEITILVFVHHVE